MNNNNNFRVLSISFHFQYIIPNTINWLNTTSLQWNSTNVWKEESIHLFNISKPGKKIIKAYPEKLELMHEYCHLKNFVRKNLMINWTRQKTDWKIRWLKGRPHPSIVLAKQKKLNIINIIKGSIRFSNPKKMTTMLRPLHN